MVIMGNMTSCSLDSFYTLLYFYKYITESLTGSFMMLIDWQIQVGSAGRYSGLYADVQGSNLGVYLVLSNIRV